MSKVVMTEEKRLPKLTKAQADAIEALKQVRCNEILVNQKIGGGWSSSKFIHANEISLNNFIIAIYVGYEVKETLQEAIRERVDSIVTTTNFDQGYKSGFDSGVKFILNTMKIDPRKVEV